MKNTIPILFDQSDNYYQKKIGDFFVSENVINKNYPLHQQDYYELEYITDGVAEHIINNGKNLVKAGDLLFITPFDFHGFNTSGIKTITCHFYAKDLSFEMSRFLMSLQSNTVKNVDENMVLNLKYLLKVFKDNDKYAEIKLRNTVELILLELFSNFTAVNVETAKDKISEAIGYININFKNDITLSLIEKKFGICASQFSRDFKKRTEKTFLEYITDKRLNYAKKLLLSGRKVIDVCFESGFGSVRTFNRAFKNRYNVCPSKFVNMQK